MPVIQFDAENPRFADVSHWQPVHDFSLYARATDAGALGFKVNEGNRVDVTAGEHLARAEASGLIAIGYSFGTQSIEVFLREFGPRPGRIPVLDFEGDVTVQGAEAWVTAVHATYGRYPWFYGRTRWAAAGAPAGTVIERCPYWGAEYGEALYVPTGVGRPVAFQFTDGQAGPLPHTMDGIGHCDINMLICSLAELRAMAGL